MLKRPVFISLVIFASLLISLSGCNSESSQSDSDADSSSVTHEHHGEGGHEHHDHGAEHDHSGSGTESLHLNDGKKWIVNSTTAEKVSEMETVANDFLTTKEEDKNCTQMGNLLDTKVGEILRACDMTGEGHNQLHIVLEEMIATIKKMKDAESCDEQAKSYLSHCETLRAHFEPEGGWE